MTKIMNKFNVAKYNEKVDSSYKCNTYVFV